jgi:hypothetical protein
MYHDQKTNSAGIWSWYGEHDRGEIAGHAETPGGPLTVFWAGLITSSRLRGFMTDVVGILCQQNRLQCAFSTTMLTDDDEIRVISERAPLLPLEIASKAGFVRFECDAAHEQLSATEPKHPIFSAWAHLDHPPADQIDAIGVFGAPEDIKLLRSHIAALVAETSHSHLNSEFISKVLTNFDTDLANRRQL